MTAALFWGPEARFAAGLALGLTLSVALFVAKGAERPAAARSVRLGTSGGRGRYDDIFARVEPLVAGIEELAVAWGNVGCAKGIYLDVGSNVGVQVRKLYHPEQFPNASVLPIFDRVFSQAPRPGVCAVGFEPNPKHSAYLGTVNAWFRRRGYPAHIFRETAVGKSKGNVTFYSAGPAELDMAASFARVPRFQGHTIINFNVTVISLVDFITKVVRPILDAEERATGRRPPVAMKLDIEGAEYAVVPGLILSGAMCEVNTAFVEWHPDVMKTPAGLDVNTTYLPDLVRQLQTVSPACTTELVDLDDESHQFGHLIPLP